MFLGAVWRNREPPTVRQWRGSPKMYSKVGKQIGKVNAIGKYNLITIVQDERQSLMPTLTCQAAHSHDEEAHWDRRWGPYYYFPTRLHCVMLCYVCWRYTLATPSWFLSCPPHPVRVSIRVSLNADLANRAAASSGIPASGVLGS